MDIKGVLRQNCGSPLMSTILDVIEDNVHINGRCYV